jgi:hypothetical protein
MVWCRTCNGTDVKRVYEDDQGDMVVFKYKCNVCQEAWVSTYKKLVSKQCADHGFE